MSRREQLARSARATLDRWFDTQGWRPMRFQVQAWSHWLEGRSGLLVTPTGSGKTLAAFGGLLLDGLAEQSASATQATMTRATTSRATTTRAAAPRTRLLWITPLRALATDTARALSAPLDALGLPWTVAMRTGDASARDRRLAREGRADIVVITPESLAMLFSYPETADRLKGLRGIVVDEWHELLGNKRGVLLQLNLARLRALAPLAPIWGLSATIGNLDEARAVLLPHQPDAPIVRTLKPRPVTISTLLPEHGERFAWAGHLGLSQLGRVASAVQRAGSALVFTNTRAQAELWHRALASIWMEPPTTLALHHGSLDAKLRTAAEQGLREGSVRCVVATSSLDLGVDFPAVDLVVQVGSPKGLARLLQRAGRARHQPGRGGRIVCVPTHALEAAEFAAARHALREGRIESRTPPRLSLDVLAQHCVTLALGGGFEPDTLLAEVRGTDAFAALRDESWQAVLAFIVRGGSALERYPEFQRVVQDEDGHYRVHDRRIAMRHRLSIGTITADGAVQVRFLRGGHLGTVEESFVSRMRPGDRFQFAGRSLELARLEDMVAYVRIAKGKAGIVPRWQGGRMPLSTELGEAVERVLSPARPDDPELVALGPLLRLQQRESALPDPSSLLVESLRTRDGWHTFIHPFAGRQVHEGMAALFAMRRATRQPNTFAFAVNDYGFVLSAQAEAIADEAMLHDFLREDALLDDLRASLNLSEMARRQFREIARIAGLLAPSFPGGLSRSVRQLQASSGLIFDVLRRYDPSHLMLGQAEREVFEAQLELQQLTATLKRCRGRRLVLKHPPTLTPLSFPLWAEAVRGHISTEDWQTRVRRTAEQMERRHVDALSAAPPHAEPTHADPPHAR